jgi:uncharacterized membrane protein
MAATTLDLPRTAAAPVSALARADTRIASIDILRGLVIVLMALDHVRDYFTNARFDPLDLAQTTPELYATRWITHLCAPIFVLLAGTSAYLIAQRLSRGQVSSFLAKRGLWLIVLELTVVIFAWTFRLDYPVGVFLQVIWAIGVSMLALALLVHLPIRAIAAIGLAIVFGHNLLDPIVPADLGAWAPLWTVVHEGGVVGFAFAAYPILPWIGIMALGYVLGVVFTWDARRRGRTLAWLGAVALVLFVLLRASNLYGDPQDWTTQRSALWTFFSFMDVEKYPPSLLYTLATLGIGLLALAALERLRVPLSNALETFGRVPLFAYVLHIVIAHALAGLLALATGHGPGVITNVFFTYPPTWGYGLGGVYVAWLVVLALLYPLCVWFAGVKRRRRDWWLAYL